MNWTQNNPFKEIQGTKRTHRQLKEVGKQCINKMSSSTKKGQTGILELKNTVIELKNSMGASKADSTMWKNQWPWRQNIWNYLLGRAKKQKEWKRVKKVYRACGIQSKETISVLWEFQKKEKGIKKYSWPFSNAGVRDANPYAVENPHKTFSSPKT